MPNLPTYLFQNLLQTAHIFARCEKFAIPIGKSHTSNGDGGSPHHALRSETCNETKCAITRDQAAVLKTWDLPSERANSLIASAVSTSSCDLYIASAELASSSANDKQVEASIFRHPMMLACIQSYIRAIIVHKYRSWDTAG